MRLWLVATGEPWPTDGDAPRLLRQGINASFLAERGHDVLWWNSLFDQRLRIVRDVPREPIKGKEGYRIVGLGGGEYHRNVSIERIRYNRAMAASFRRLALDHPAPDVIVVSLTPLELCRAVVEHGRRIGCPVIVDVRDLWPDIWYENLPEWCHPAARLALWPFYYELKRAIRQATAITGVTEAAVDWALAAAQRSRGPLERAFPLVYASEVSSEDKIGAATAWWRAHGVEGDATTIVGCYFGALTSRADFDTPIRALRQLPDALRGRVRLVFCGRGEAETAIRQEASGLGEVIVPGWIDAAHIRALMRLSTFGILPYRPTLDYVRSLPNKVFEYLSGDLLILTSLRGEIERLLADFPCGLLYDAGRPETFRDALINLASSPDLVVRMRSQARAAAAKFDVRASCQAFEAFVLEVASVKAGYAPAIAASPR